jgi:hypothetical protein
MLHTITTQIQRKAALAVVVPDLQAMIAALESGETIIVDHADTVCDLTCRLDNADDETNPVQVRIVPIGKQFELTLMSLPTDTIEDNERLGRCGEPLRNCMTAERLGLASAMQLAAFSRDAGEKSVDALGIYGSKY